MDLGFGFSGLRKFRGAGHLGLRSSDALQPRLSSPGPSGLKRTSLPYFALDELDWLATLML